MGLRDRYSAWDLGTVSMGLKDRHSAWDLGTDSQYGIKGQTDSMGFRDSQYAEGAGKDYKLVATIGPNPRWPPEPFQKS